MLTTCYTTFGTITNRRKTLKFKEQIWQTVYLKSYSKSC